MSIFKLIAQSVLTKYGYDISIYHSHIDVETIKRGRHGNRTPFYKHWLTLIPAWISKSYAKQCVGWKKPCTRIIDIMILSDIYYTCNTRKSMKSNWFKWKLDIGTGFILQFTFCNISRVSLHYYTNYISPVWNSKSNHMTKSCIFQDSYIHWFHWSDGESWCHNGKYQDVLSVPVVGMPLFAGALRY